jgi:presenilin-like A22 family membrane protease
MVIGYYSPKQMIVEGYNDSVTYYNLPYGMNPPLEAEKQEILPVLIYLIVVFSLATLFYFLLSRFGLVKIMRIWFLVVVSLALAVSLNAGLAFIGLAYADIFALIIGAFLGFLKVFKRGVIVHNITELLIYPGIGAIFSAMLLHFSKDPIALTVFGLIVFSAYDIYAVWHAGFMQKMAKFQMNTLKIFAGFFIPYIGKKEKELIDKARKSNIKDKKIKVNIAALGGGDVVFPLVLAGAVLHSWGILPALIIALGSTAALSLLFAYSEKGKFYPALPFLSAGCFVALVFAYLIR